MGANLCYFFKPVFGGGLEAVNHIAGLLLQWSYEALKPIKERDHMQLWESGSLILNTSSQSMNAPQAMSNDSETLNPIILPNSLESVSN